MDNYISKIPLGYSKGMYEGVCYGISKTEFNRGKSIKIFAESLAGTDFVSLNYYITSKSKLLKPCQISEEKVFEFLKNVELI